jgi:hypothetical protein
VFRRHDEIAPPQASRIVIDARRTDNFSGRSDFRCDQFAASSSRDARPERKAVAAIVKSWRAGLRGRNVLRSLDKWRDFKFPPFSHLPAIRPRCRARMWHVARARRRVEPRNTTHTNDPRVHSRCGSHKRARTRSEQTRLRPRAGNAAFNAADGAFDGGQKRRRKRVRLGGWWRRWARPGDNGELRYLESISGSRRGQTRAPRYLPPPPLPPLPRRRRLPSSGDPNRDYSVSPESRTYIPRRLESTKFSNKFLYPPAASASYRRPGAPYYAAVRRSRISAYLDAPLSMISGFGFPPYDRGPPASWTLTSRAICTPECDKKSDSCA